MQHNEMHAACFIVVVSIQHILVPRRKQAEQADSAQMKVLKASAPSAHQPSDWLGGSPCCSGKYFPAQSKQQSGPGLGQGADPSGCIPGQKAQACRWLWR